MDLSVDRLPFPGSTISGTWVNRDGEMWRVDFALGKRVPLPCPLLLGASFHSIWCCYFFSPAWGLFWREAELGVNGNWQIFFFSVTWILCPSPLAVGLSLPYSSSWLQWGSRQATFVLVGIPVQSLLILDLAPSGHSHMRVPHTKYPIHVQKQWVHWKSKLLGLLLLMPLLFLVKIICDFIIRI